MLAPSRLHFAQTKVGQGDKVAQQLQHRTENCELLLRLWGGQDAHCVLATLCCLVPALT